MPTLHMRTSGRALAWLSASALGFCTISNAAEAQSCSGTLIPAAAVAFPVPSQPGTGLDGEYWDQPATSNATAEAVIAAGNPDAAFIATHLDYPNGAVDVLGASSTISQLLGVDAFSGSHANDPVPGFVFHFTGFLRIDAPGNVTFALGSDDGTKLEIAGRVVVDNPGIHAFAVQSGVACFQAAGLYPVDIIFYNDPAHGGIELHSSLPGGPNSGPPTGTVGIVPLALLYPDVPIVPANYSTTGTPCVGLAGMPTLTARNLPLIGTTFTVDVNGLSGAAVPFMLLGFSSTNWVGGALPYPITQLGPPTCNLLVSPDATVYVPATAGTATWSLALPNNTSLLSILFFNQCIAPAVAGTTLGISASGRGDGMVGNQ